MAVTVGYVGATGRDVGYFGTAAVDAVAININQIDPAVARARVPCGRMGRGMRRRCAPSAQSVLRYPWHRRLGGRQTVPAGQLLRPFPQFGDVNAYEMTDGGRRQYHAATFVLDKRPTGWWGGRFSYTLSQTKDNQFGQESVYQTRTAPPQNNYDLDAEYGVSDFDSPHRIVLAPIMKLPSPASSGGISYWLLNGWNVSSVVELVSGAPLNAVTSGGASDGNLGLLGGRQRPNVSGDANTSAATEIGSPTTATNPPATSTAPRSRILGPGLRRRPADDQRRALSVPEERRPRDREGHRPLRREQRRRRCASRF